MPKVRPINERKYGISKYRFREAYNFCLQYHEWKEELKHTIDALKSPEINDMPRAAGQTSDTTAMLATRRAELTRKCELVEQTAIEADVQIYQYIIDAVTNEGTSYRHLKIRKKIPCGKDMYYDRRRKFYYLLSNKL